MVLLMNEERLEGSPQEKENRVLSIRPPAASQPGDTGGKESAQSLSPFFRAEDLKAPMENEGRN